MPLTRILFTGLCISFLGTLPLGTLNVIAAQMAVDDGIGPAIWFSLGALLAEMCYVRLSLVAMSWIRRQKRWLLILETGTVVIILLLAAGSLRAAFSPDRHGMPVVIAFISPAPLPRFFTGLLLSAVNPLQIPFWFGWSTILFKRGILQNRADFYNSYILGIGLGTFAGNAVFIFGGRFFVHSLSMHQSLVNGIIGIIFAITAILQIRKILLHRSGIEKL